MANLQHFLPAKPILVVYGNSATDNKSLEGLKKELTDYHLIFLMHNKDLDFKVLNAETLTDEQYAELISSINTTLTH